jgi:thiosulfate dehydrogenase
MIRKGLLTAVIILLLVLTWLWRKPAPTGPASIQAQPTASVSAAEPLWAAPDSNTIPRGETGDLIRYGKKLISTTAFYFGPQGSLTKNANGMNCQNCHLKAGTQAWAGSFGSVASLFPRFSDRRGSAETINQPITDCFERSMNGHAPDSNSREMKAMNAYICWVGKGVVKGKKPKGTGLELLAYLDRPADPQKGKQVYATKCQSCHGPNGNGQPDSAGGYRYPPLWGEHSYNTAAGLYRLSKFAGFIKDNMPYGSDYANEQLTVEQAWDLAAFVNSQPRPTKKFKQDWPFLRSKPVDLPEGPFMDSFSVTQHKYGPYAPIALQKKALTEKK